MITTANYILKAMVCGETYLFEYHDTWDALQTLEKFYHEDYTDMIINFPGSGEFPIDIQAMEGGRVIRTYHLQFNSVVFNHFFDKGHKAGCITYTKQEFLSDISRKNENITDDIDPTLREALNYVREELGEEDLAIIHAQINKNYKQHQSPATGVNDAKVIDLLEEYGADYDLSEGWWMEWGEIDDILLML